MKSQSDSLLKVARGLLKDVHAAYPAYEGVLLDERRITLYSRKRGLGVFTLDLPNLDQLLLEGLETGRLALSGPCSRAVSKKIRVPRLFSGLWLRVFDTNGCLNEEPDVTAIAFLRQLTCLGKKVEVPCHPSRVALTMGEYHGIEQELPTPSLRWDEDSLDPNNDLRRLHFRDRLDHDFPNLFGQSYDESVRERLGSILDNLGTICAKVASEFSEYNPSSHKAYGGGRTEQGFKHGPGAVADARSSRESKYSFKNWPAKLEGMFPFDEHGCVNHNHFLDREFPSAHEPPSILYCVPKTAKAPRLIAAEPTAHQWCQQSIADYMCSRFDALFRGKFLTIRDQEPSRRMALQASLDGRLATVDLSSASDRLSCWAIERMWKGNKLFLNYIHSCRTRWTVDNISRDKTFVRLKKFSTQGSALTFPMQSLFFLCCALSVLPKKTSLKEYLRSYGDQVRVFGDDIIIPRTGYADLTLLLHYLGLKVNLRKSFSVGLFRESCGMDAYGGYDVTPVKSKGFGSDDPTSVAATIDYSNNLFLKGYWHAAIAAEQTVEKDALRIPIKGTGVGPIGRISFCGSFIPPNFKIRWNVDLHRAEVLTMDVISKVRRKATEGYDALFQWFTERPLPDSRWVNGVASRPKNRKVRRWVTLDDYSVNSPVSLTDSRAGVLPISG